MSRFIPNLFKLSFDQLLHLITSYVEEMDHPDCEDGSLSDSQITYMQKRMKKLDPVKYSEYLKNLDVYYDGGVLQ
jgi:hypothetical protein